MTVTVRLCVRPTADVDLLGHAVVTDFPQRTRTVPDEEQAAPENGPAEADWAGPVRTAPYY